jgi:hypothetical protein
MRNIIGSPWAALLSTPFHPEGGREIYYLHYTKITRALRQCEAIDLIYWSHFCHWLRCTDVLNTSFSELRIFFGCGETRIAEPTFVASAEFNSIAHYSKAQGDREGLTVPQAFFSITLALL